MGMILRIASSRIVGQGDIVGRSGYFSLNLSANSVMRGRLDARRTLKSLVADLRTIYGMALFFLPMVSGFGLVISNHSTTLQQAMFVMWFFMLILILMSGLFTPIHSMPEWAQWITCINPLRYFVEVMRTIYLRGGGFAELLPQLGAVLVFALVFNLWAVKSYKKSS